VNGLNVQTVQTIISEIGVDMSRWNTEKNFASWLGLCPDNRVSGGKVLKRGTRQVVNRAATALRLAAWSLIRSQSALGANFRRLRSKLGAPKAVTAMAHKLARLVYRMLKFGADYIDKGMEAYESRYRHQQTKWLTKQAAALNFQLIPASNITDWVSGDCSSQLRGPPQMPSNVLTVRDYLSSTSVPHRHFDLRTL